MKIKGLKRNVIGALIVIILILCIGLLMKNNSKTLNNTSINEESIVEELNENLIGAYIQQGEEYVKADTIPTSGYEFNEENSKYAHIKKDKEESLRTNRDTERRIRLARSVPNLDFCTLKRNNQEEINFIYALKKECYKNYVEEWNEEIQKKLFERYIKENGKHIKIITLKGEKIGFFDGKNIDNDIFEIKNICISLEYQNKGIEKAILEEILFENKDKKVKLQCFKSNPAISLYNKLGFQTVGETKSHYEMEK